ncbi:MAG: AMP-binding protein [Burkholderiales bacterium]|nr:AMP-binding protein [Burkholderiales bacterium]
MEKSGHVDSFARDNLPPQAQWPHFLLDRPEFAYPPRFNCAVSFLDDMVAKGFGPRDCILSPEGRWTYSDLLGQVNRIAAVLTGRFGLEPGNRVLLRAPNNPMMVATYLAVIKAGGVVVATMPLLRAKELATIIEKAKITHAVCDARLTEELDKARRVAPSLTTVVIFGDAAPESLETMAAGAPDRFEACDTAAEDVCLIGFTSGTTGVPKGTMHFHRDMLAICDAYSHHLLRPTPDDRFIGSPPLAFTFGLGGLVLFPLRVGASTVLLEKASPPDLLKGVEDFRATISFTAPTAYRAMIPLLEGRNISSLRICVSAGEALPKPTFDAWKEATGIAITEGIGATEMLHIFIGSSPDDVRPGATGKPVPGYEARVVDDAMNDVPDGTPGRLAVRGPTGCRYLADDRQATYVRDGWNVTGDTYVRDGDGYFWYQARSDDMIVSAGYNIAGPEVEAALLTHPAVKECGVVGQPDPDRGMIVKAYVVPSAGVTPGDDLVKALQDHVKAEISPYKYPRAVEFVSELPRTDTGKLRRSVLRERAATPAAF